MIKYLSALVPGERCHVLHQEYVAIQTTCPLSSWPETWSCASTFTPRTACSNACSSHFRFISAFLHEQCYSPDVGMICMAGEVRHGDWGFVDEALPADVTDTPPEDLMRRLSGSTRVTWLA